ncbi:MAG: response regulator [Deltaproteobacteria bacterium]|nr:response regulator [Deltaproteobacteria bacterium]
MGPDPRQFFSSLLDATPDIVGMADAQGRLLYLNGAGRRALGVGDADLSSKHFTEFHPEWARRLLEVEGLPAALRDGNWLGETALLGPNGAEIPVSQLVVCHKNAAGEVQIISTIARDIGAQKRQEQERLREATERRRLEAQLAQAQKMESIGRLAGGVAHDFNNLLTSILGHVEFAESTLPPQHPARAELRDVARASERAASLTRQLLAFARRQMVAPTVLDLNTLLLEMDRMLRRLIGENIELVTLFAPELWAVRADRGQVEQLVVNLVLNARDAMPQGGTLRLETANAQLGEEHIRRNPDLMPGDYTVLIVSDTGVGMSDEVLAHLFEPFFTTKERAHGSGLGLASSYGIARQSGGHIWASSGPERGSTFRVYLPRHRGDHPAQESSAAPRGTELILLVEDEPHVRAVTARTLRASGYDVLEAAHGEEALQLFEATSQPIRLLVTDVVMPMLGGRDLAARLLEKRPELKVLYISGYTDDESIPRAAMPGVAFLQKPFTSSVLARKVRDVLDQGRK